MITPANIVKRIPASLRRSAVFTERGTINKHILAAIQSLPEFAGIGSQDIILMLERYRFTHRTRIAEAVAKSPTLEDVVSNGVQHAYVEKIKTDAKKSDKLCRWVPSTAQNPDPTHQRNYGKIFQLSKGIRGEIPGERYGCKCSFVVVSEV